MNSNKYKSLIDIECRIKAVLYDLYITQDQLCHSHELTDSEAVCQAGIENVQHEVFEYMANNCN